METGKSMQILAPSNNALFCSYTDKQNFSKNGGQPFLWVKKPLFLEVLFQKMIDGERPLFLLQVFCFNLYTYM